MAFKEVADLNPDNTISLGGSNKKTGKKNPTEIEGYYLGSRKVADKKKKTGFSFIHVFETSKGPIGVWGKTDMDRKLEGLTPGVMTRVSYDKMVATPNGDMYKYKVATDEDNVTDTTLPLNSYEAEEENLGEGQDDFNEEEEQEEETSGRSNGLAASERQEKVAAILNKGKAGNKRVG